MERYYYDLYLSNGVIFCFYNNKKILIKEYRSIIDNIMNEISIANCKEEPYICANEKFYQNIKDKLRFYGFIPVISKYVNYDIEQLKVH